MLCQFCVSLCLSYKAINLPKMKKILQRLCLVLLGLGIQAPLKAQFSLDKYIEIAQLENTKSEEENIYQILPINKKGLLVIRHKEHFIGKTPDFEVLHLDTILEIKSRDNFKLDDAFTKEVIWHTDLANKNLYAVGQDAPMEKKFHLFHFNIQTRVGQSYEAKFPFAFDVNKINVSEDIAYLSGVYDDKHLVVSFTFLDKSVRVLPTFFEDKEIIQQVQEDTLNHQLYYIIQQKSRGEQDLYIKPYSSLIGVGKKMELVPRARELKKKTFEEAYIYTPSSQENWVVGTYSFEDKDFWQGLYVTKFEAGLQKSLNYFRFQEFGNFFKHYKNRRRRKLEEKMKQYSQQDKVYTFGRRMMWQEPIANEKQIIVNFIGYYLQYPSNTFMWQQANRMPTTNTYPTYPYYRGNTTSQGMSYHYDYIAYAGFDKLTGRLLWDNLMKIDDLELAEPNANIAISTIGDSVVTAYLKNKNIYSQMTYKRQRFDEPQKQEGSELLKDKGVKELETCYLLAWYDEYFLISGEVKTILSKKNMFQCSKIKYQPKSKKKDTNK